MIFSRLNPFRKSPPLVPVIRLSGMIMASSGFRRSLSMASMAPLIDKAAFPGNAKNNVDPADPTLFFVFLGNA